MRVIFVTVPVKAFFCNAEGHASKGSLNVV
jgi:hypothetical protein